MGVVYGIEVSPKDDRYISVAETALDGMARAANPGAFLVDIIPSCECKLLLVTVFMIPDPQQI